MMKTTARIDKDKFMGIGGRKENIQKLSIFADKERFPLNNTLVGYSLIQEVSLNGHSEENRKSKEKTRTIRF